MKIVRIDEMPQIINQAASWFSEKWNVPEDTYLSSITESLDTKTILPKWYLVLKNGEIIAGAGVISNAPQIQREKRPNICAVYVEQEYRGNGIAGVLLEYICMDMALHGISSLYLITELNTFYERYGWDFITEIEDDENKRMRLYKRQLRLTGR